MKLDSFWRPDLGAYHFMMRPTPLDPTATKEQVDKWEAKLRGYLGLGKGGSNGTRFRGIPAHLPWPQSGRQVVEVPDKEDTDDEDGTSSVVTLKWTNGPRKDTPEYKELYPTWEMVQFYLREILREAVASQSWMSPNVR